MNTQNLTWCIPEIKKAQLLDLPINEYHSDHISKTPTLSPSQAHTLIYKSPAHLWLEHPRLGNQPRPINNEKLKKMEEGSLLHKLILGAGREYKIITGFTDYKTQKARDLRDSIRASECVPVLECVFEDRLKIANRIKARMSERRIELTGQSEMMMAYQEEADNGDEVLCRIMPDHFALDQGEIYELKLCYCAHPEVLSRQISNMGYDLQMFAYMRGVSALHPDLFGRLNFFWIFAELNPPYPITVCQPSGQMIEYGRLRWARAVNLWNECLKNNNWPEYTEGVFRIDPPAWAMKNEIGEFYGNTESEI